MYSFVHKFFEETHIRTLFYLDKKMWLLVQFLIFPLLAYDSVVHVMFVSMSYKNSTIIALDCFKWSRTCQIYLTIFYEILHFKVNRILDLEFQDYYLPFKLIFT